MDVTARSWHEPGERQQPATVHAAGTYPDQNPYDPALTSQQQQAFSNQSGLEHIAGSGLLTTELTARPRPDFDRNGTPHQRQMATEVVLDMAGRRPVRPQLSAPLTLRTTNSSGSSSDPSSAAHSDLGPPATLRRGGSSGGASSAGLRSEHSMDGLSASPKAERLPSFRQLSKIAAAGEEESEPRSAAYPNAPPFPSTLPSQSPVVPPQSYPPPPQISPANSYSYNTVPALTASVQGDARDPYYANSPPSATYPVPTYFHRRSSVSHRNAPAFPASLPSASSGESYGQQSSTSTEGGYSTAQTTPIESSVSLDSGGRPTLPLLPHMQQAGSSIQGSFVCDYPGCTAAPFQTQYLLNSHANVHSSSRPHYCHVEGCPRAEGGKGFKRKNEMIRHGLVHDSPGYMCPFCPDREHRYPRPDNLQRHVRVHHIDKDKDDPALREVLSQRAEGGNRGRRRRTGP